MAYLDFFLMPCCSTSLIIHVKPSGGGGICAIWHTDLEKNYYYSKETAATTLLISHLHVVYYVLSNLAAGCACAWYIRPVVDTAPDAYSYIYDYINMIMSSDCYCYYIIIFPIR